MDTDFLAYGIAWFVVFVTSVTLHEAAHALVAWRLGDPTAYEGGQVSLDPVAHIRREPFGMVIVPILSYAIGGWMIGWASTPYSVAWAERHPRRSAWMALAGPAANLLLVILAGLFIRLGLHLGWFTAPDKISPEHVALAVGGWTKAAAILASILFSLNVILLVFNLLPFPPLDGSGALELLLPGDHARRLRRFLHQPGLSTVGLLLAWYLFGYIFFPVFRFALNLLYWGHSSYG
ncbi:MAG: site-2 protease family protein [Sedimentisphaerales bacterium]|nr:site-2 protease family protein [Sedimentisphaerales bacterium]